MTDTPSLPKQVNVPKPSKARQARQARLDAALRANLRRRKAPEKAVELDVTAQASDIQADNSEGPDK